ncbi:Rieske (2Fe-2S) protein [Catellatospora tritici]|uniref:Rieske (2Fe-2S) protein n=1 Tax=Catellatospora tritici TaxID=2851566 RepID=UPI001C2CD3E0|nr:Rieske (2Fe-2S) protein [Catellatospora tritici]MBV1854166.1 Rieske 2Fe-2S domain-containing protein [Catellatospora tritici]
MVDTGATRRVLLAGVCGAGLGAVSAACGGAAGPPEAGASSTAKAAPTGPVVLGPVTDVPVDGGKVYETAQVVVTQPQQGVYKAFTSVCTHRQCQVGSVASNQISCPCHGSKFSAEDGSVINGPATLPLEAKKITVDNGQIVLSN